LSVNNAHPTAPAVNPRLIFPVEYQIHLQNQPPTVILSEAKDLASEFKLPSHHVIPTNYELFYLSGKEQKSQIL